MSAGGGIRVDVLVIGGGLQGLLVMDRCTRDGRSCVLATAGELGVGQTLHSHGVLNTGFGMAGPGPVEVLSNLALPDLARRGVATYGEWGAIVPPGFPGGEATAPPLGLAVGECGYQRLREVNFDKRELLQALAGGVEGRVITGSMEGVTRDAGGEVRSVEVLPSSGQPSITLEPRVVVVAAGTGTKGLLRRFGADEGQLEPLKHRRVHVLCVRGPRQSLQPLNFVSFPDQMFVAGHDRSGTVTWLATPMDFAAPPVEDVPADASATVDEHFAAAGWTKLARLYPALDSTPGLRFATYAGYRQDIGDMPGTPKCEVLDGVPNVVMALPSGLLGAWMVQAMAAPLIAKLVPTPTPQPVLPAANPLPAVGPDHEDTPGIAWEERRPFSS